MIYTDEKQLYNHISELMMGEGIDFVVYAIVSPWHAIGVDALVYNISQRKNEKLSGMVIINAHPISGFLINEADFACPSFATVQFFFLDCRLKTQESGVSTRKEFFKTRLNILRGIVNIRREGKRHEKEVRIVSVLVPNITFLQIFRDRRLAGKYSPTFSILDEGMSTYFPIRNWVLIMKSINQTDGRKHFQLAQFLRTKMQRRLYRPLGIMALRFVTTEYLFLFREERGKLIPNDPVVNSYRYIIEKKGEVYEKTKNTRPLALVITQPFSELWQVSLTYELSLIETVVDILVQMDFDILLKPHPSEPPGKYDPILTKFESERVRLSLNNKVPVEILFPSLDPACIIGYTSTALVIAKTMYDIPAITIIDIIATVTDEEAIRLNQSEFKRLTAEICSCADTFEKLKDILSSVKVT